MSEQQYWFPAKRYGYGWGLPATWQGWVVLRAFFALLLVGAFVLPPSRYPGGAPHTQLSCVACSSRSALPRASRPSGSGVVVEGPDGLTHRM